MLSVTMWQTGYCCRHEASRVYDSGSGIMPFSLPGGSTLQWGPEPATGRYVLALLYLYI